MCSEMKLARAFLLLLSLNFNNSVFCFDVVIVIKYLIHDSIFLL